VTSKFGAYVARFHRFMASQRDMKDPQKMWGELMAFENNAPSIVGPGFPCPIAWIIDLGGENPPLRQIAWVHLILKDHKSAPRLIFIRNSIC